ncbi:hypothetical protein KEM54_003972 [Ascosphaera aggregata]|nr:hypothetical protein KEM54_003972 [Ascosphaera aggregata]
MQTTLRTCWDYSFHWTQYHMTPEQLDPLKFSYDKLADDCLLRLKTLLSSNKAGTSICRSDLYTLLKKHRDRDETLIRFWNEVHSVPDWCNWEQINRGQECFHRYSLAIARALKSHSLVGGMSASRIVETLVRTGGFSPDVARRRILETTHFVAAITESLDSIQLGGEGHVAAIKVRLLHASVRRRILELTSSRPSYYDLGRFGVPANDLDSIATIGSFSAALIWRGLPRQGVYMRMQEIEDFVALWRLVAHYIGTPTEYFRSPQVARAMLESIVCAEVAPNDKSIMMANNIIKSLVDTPPIYVSLELSNVTARWLNGNHLADGLGIDNASCYYWLLLMGINVFISTWCYVNRTIPILDRWQISVSYLIQFESKIPIMSKPLIDHIPFDSFSCPPLKKTNQMSRKQWRESILNNSYGLGKKADFNFEHVPAYDKGTSSFQQCEKQLPRWAFMRVSEVTGLMGLLIAAAVSWVNGFYSTLEKIERQPPSAKVTGVGILDDEDC